MKNMPADYSDLPLFATLHEEHYWERSQLIREKRMPPTKIQSSDDAATYIREQISDYDREAFVVLSLSTRHSINAASIVHIGSATESVVDTSDILRVALYSNARCIIIAHNHPSGESSPSAEDRAVTKKVKEAAALLNVTLLDHIIIGANEYYSFADSGLL